MKKRLCVFLGLLGLTMTLPVAAQTIEFGGMDASPMDAAHYPRRAAFQNYLSDDDPDRTQYMKVLYCRPQVKGREIFGELVPWGQDWRLGANEATEVSFYRAAEIGGTTIPAGTYTMFAQVYPDQWIIKLSTQRFIAGAENRDISQDILAISVPTELVSESREFFTIGFKKIDDNNAQMVMGWDHTQVAVPINFNPTFMAGEDASPMDLVQFPNRSRMRNYVEEDELDANEPQIRLVYSRPQMKGREIFGGLLEYGSVWRAGANETTTLTFFNDVTIDGQEIPAGQYGLFIMVHEDKWDFHIHNSVQSWGPANYDVEENNIMIYSAPTESTPETLEALSATFVDKGNGMIHLAMGWENTMARLPIQLAATR
ncbi:MAG: DUF2911 domain-containing protein [Bacteroidota bacterium]